MRSPVLANGYQRILPSGCVHIVFALSRDFLVNITDSSREERVAPGLLVGARSVYEVVANSDFTELAGILFEPGGLARFSRERVDAFSNRSFDLEDIWGSQARSLRDRLLDIDSPQAKLACLETFLSQNCRLRPAHSDLIAFAVDRFRRGPVVAGVQEVAQDAGLSVRHFSQLFREQVGLPPKVWSRIRRFQQAVRQLHSGRSVRWAELALNCGYYDQSHFANEFRAFSGIDVTSYCARRTQWANHITAD